MATWIVTYRVDAIIPHGKVYDIDVTSHSVTHTTHYVEAPKKGVRRKLTALAVKIAEQQTERLKSRGIAGEWALESVEELEADSLEDYEKTWVPK